MTTKYVAVLVKSDSKVVLVRDDEGWKLPGGKIDPGDRNEIMAAARELGEELPHLVINRVEFLGIAHTIKRGESHAFAMYRVESLDPLNLDPGAEVLEAKLLPIQEAIEIATVATRTLLQKCFGWV